MMGPSWMRFCSLLVLFAGSSESGRCPIAKHESSSQLLDSLRCYNNYKSYVHCEWVEPEDLSVQLWFKTFNNSREQCLCYSGPKGDAGKARTAQCRYNTNVLTIGVIHTVFFLEDKTEQLCRQEPLDLSQHLGTQPPVNLSVHDTDDGGCRLSWSGPYPPKSSLHQSITYQLDYRRDGGDKWTTQIVNSTSMRLDKQRSHQGCKYEARVRARVSVGQWSQWIPQASRQKEEAVGGGHAPIPRCVLVEQGTAKCSWEVSAEVSQIVTHQLLCGPNHTALTEQCCKNQTVNSDPGGRVLEYSCLLTGADRSNLLLELLPTHKAKTFRANHHIRFDPPEQVTVREKGSIWVVDWTGPGVVAGVYYQLCYYSKEKEQCSIQNVSEDTTSFNIPQDSLVPSQKYHVKVRSLVLPGEESTFRGIPSQWSSAATWTSNEATWSLPTLIYFFISMFVAIGFFAIYCAAMACQRKMTLWVDSIPSPGKSKILTEIKVAKSRTQTLLKKPFVSKDPHIDSVLTWSTDVSLWSNKSGERKLSQKEDGCWECDKQTFICDHGNGPNSSCMGFSGLYILCWERQLNGVKDTPTSSEDPALTFTVGERDYVCLPGHSICSSAQYHFSPAGVGTNLHQNHVEQQQQCLPDSGEMLEEVEDEQEPQRPPTSNIHLSTLYRLASGDLHTVLGVLPSSHRPRMS
uniref:Fibronectin type-III domain-containing protein n=1 Tax=Tetraodon nigroviridis TaxID=99883 RepID=H3C1A8_TETNG